MIPRRHRAADLRLRSAGGDQDFSAIINDIRDRSTKGGQ
ncbi:hypothetical protein Pd630_LPD17004 (plasmid) [Rhodococcus opacus PD630]|nr:hypothetical protein Pd630_LPD17004 [Rhodococcus opacus PD630]